MIVVVDHAMLMLPRVLGGGDATSSVHTPHPARRTAIPIEKDEI